MSNDMPDVMRSLDNAYDHIQHECYNDALSSILEAKDNIQQLIKEAEERQRERLMAVIERHDDHGQISVQVITNAILNAGGE